MKKIMLSAAVLAALIGTATAATTVTSANTVGYQEIALKAGFNMITPTFLNTGASDNTYSIQDIKISDADGTYGNGTESIQIVDAAGNVSATYTWWGEADGWCDEEQSVSVNLKQGEGFLLYTEGEGTATVKGAVAVGTLEKNLGVGFNGFGNASPVAIDIQKITISDADGTYGNGTESIQLIDTDGNVSATYTWWGEADGWCDEESSVNVDIQPGESFLLYTEGEGTVKAPMAIAK